MKTSIVIATRNRAPLLRRTLESIRRQSYKDVETIVVDDASEDGTSRLQREFKEVRFHRIDRAGGYRKNPGPVYNVGHRLATGDLHIEQNAEVIHVNDCVLPFEGLVERGRAVFGTVIDGASELFLLEQQDFGFRQHWVNTETNGEKLAPPQLRTGHSLFSGLRRPIPFFFLGAMHRDDWERLGGYPEDNQPASDERFAKQMIDGGMCFAWTSEAVGFHQRHSKT